MSAPARPARTRTVRECADEIGMSVDFIRDCIKTGELPARWCGNHFRVLDKTWQRFVDAFDGTGSS